MTNASRERVQRPKYILLITIDSLRADALERGDDLPNLTWFRERSMVFTRAYAVAPFTTFSVASLFTSKLASDLEFYHIHENLQGVYIKNTTTLPQYLSENGYTAIGINTNPLLSSDVGFQQGFDVYKEPSILGLKGSLEVFVEKIARLLRKTPYETADVVNQKALELLREHVPTNLFLWTHYMDIHGPYYAAGREFSWINKLRSEFLWQKAIRDNISSADARALRKHYDQEVVRLDQKLGDLFKGLVEQGIWEDCLIIITADHGDEFGEHGQYGHKHKLYNELLQVPLMVKLPAVSVSRQSADKITRVDSPVSLLDVFPTVVQAVGSGEDNGFTDVLSQLRGKSLLSRTPERRRAIVAESDVHPCRAFSVIDYPLKLIHGTDGSDELYNLLDDPGERTDLSRAEPKRVGYLKELYLSMTSDKERERVAESDQGLNDALKQRLKDLGYME